MAHFDWYQATVDEYPLGLVEGLMEMPGAFDFDRGRGRNNYQESVKILDRGGGVLATVLHGGLNGAPNAYGSGEHAEPFSAILRKYWPDAHRVTRVDSAEDVIGDFDDLVRSLELIGEQHGIDGERIAKSKHNRKAKGDTYYLGSNQSSVQHRAYEKAQQLLSMKKVRPGDVDENLLRCEAQWRPVRDARSIAAKLSADEMWGVSPLLRHIASQVLEKAALRVPVRPRLRTTHEARVAAFKRQYGSLMHDMLRDHGSWDLVGVEIGRIMTEN
jgi:hypothetical protein